MKKINSRESYKTEKYIKKKNDKKKKTTNKDL